MKTCPRCKEEKEPEEFSHRSSRCRDCEKARHLNDHRNNLDNIISCRYSWMYRRAMGSKFVKSRALGQPILSKSEFFAWAHTPEQLEILKQLRDDWEENEFSRRYTPSVDRIDSLKGYTVDNIQWLPLYKNISKH